MRLVTLGWREQLALPQLGIGMLNEARMKTNFDFLIENKLIDPAKVSMADAYKLDFVKDLKVMP